MVGHPSIINIILFLCIYFFKLLFTFKDYMMCVRVSDFTKKHLEFYLEASLSFFSLKARVRGVPER